MKVKAKAVILTLKDMYEINLASSWRQLLKMNIASDRSHPERSEGSRARKGSFARMLRMTVWTFTYVIRFLFRSRDVRIISCVFLSLMFFLPACTTENSGLNSTTVKGAAAGAATGAVVGGVTNVGIPMGVGVGAVIGGAVGYWLSEKPGPVEILGSYGVSVMRLGDHVVFTIPSIQLFKGYSVQMSNSGQVILQQIALLLEPMNKVQITIAAYANSAVQTEKDLFLTQQQAETVSNYLWDNHVDARMFNAIGYGGGHPIQYAPNKQIEDIIGDYTNYRVEISLKDYVL